MGADSRPCLKNSNMTSGEEFCPLASNFFAGILADFKEKLGRPAVSYTHLWCLLGVGQREHNQENEQEDDLQAPCIHIIGPDYLPEDLCVQFASPPNCDIVYCSISEGRAQRGSPRHEKRMSK